MEVIKPHSDNDDKDMRNHWLPLYSGELACGLFGISDDFVESYLSLDEKFMKNKESTFYVRASGNSMSPRIENQDILVVDRSLPVLPNCVVALYYNGVPMCKQFIKREEKTYLHSFNSSHKDIEIQKDDELVIFGTVIGLVRDFF